MIDQLRTSASLVEPIANAIAEHFCNCNDCKGPAITLHQQIRASAMDCNGSAPTASNKLAIGDCRIAETIPKGEEDALTPAAEFFAPQTSAGFSQGTAHRMHSPAAAKLRRCKG